MMDRTGRALLSKRPHARLEADSTEAQRGSEFGPVPAQCDLPPGTFNCDHATEYLRGTNRRIGAQSRIAPQVKTARCPALPFNPHDAMRRHAAHSFIEDDVAAPDGMRRDGHDRQR